MPPAGHEEAREEDERDQGEQLQAVPERGIRERPVRGQRLPGRQARERCPARVLTRDQRDRAEAEDGARGERAQDAHAACLINLRRSRSVMPPQMPNICPVSRA